MTALDYQFYSDEISIITGTIQEFATTSPTSTPIAIYQVAYDIPFFVWIVIVLPALIIFSRLLIEFTIRLRK